MVIQGLGAGGAERVFAILASAWAARGWIVEAATYSDDAPFHRLPANVAHHCLGVSRPSLSLMSAVGNLRRRIHALRALIVRRRPDVVISFAEGVNIDVLLATIGLPIPVIVSPRCDPRSREFISLARQCVRHFTHRRAARIVMQTRRAQDVMPRALRSRCVVIPNPVVPYADLATHGAGGVSLPAVRRPAIVGLGRLSPEKGFDLLIDAFAILRQRQPDWRLVVAGDGPQKEALVRQTERLGIAERVAFVGLCANVVALFRQADIFALPSRSEGFPNTLCEAMTCGLPVVAADCPMGPREIVRDGIDGLLVPPNDAPALAHSIERLQIDSGLRSRLAARATEVERRFSVERILGLWDTVLAPTLPRWLAHESFQGRAA